MAEENESFDEKLAHWTVPELKDELSRTDHYGPKKLNRLEQEITRRGNATDDSPVEPDVEAREVPTGRGSLGIVVGVILAVLVIGLALYFG